MNISTDLYKISRKVDAGERLSTDDAVALYQSHDLALIGSLAMKVKRRKSADKVFFNRNFHIEPTNVCVFECTFCAYRRSPRQDGSWDYELSTMFDLCRPYRDKAVSEVHIVGGVHPKRDITFYENLLSGIKEILPGIHIKAFTAVELDWMIRKSGLTLDAGLRRLKSCGLDSIPGGGAEIFDPEVRRQICGSKAPAHRWLEIHEAAHRAGLPSNASMLYGHVETYAHRAAHLDKLRTLQDATGGFNAFIPLKYKSGNNALSQVGEVNLIETMKNFAVCRLFLDNIPHIKSYWPMLGKATALLALSFGADDMDGTIDDTTRIYSMAGSDETSPSITADEMTQLISDAGFTAVERDSLYGELSSQNFRSQESGRQE